MRILFKFFSFLFEGSRIGRRSRTQLICVVLAGVVAGFGSTALIATINSVLAGHKSTGATWLFVILCIVIPSCAFLSQIMLVQLTERVAYDLRMRLAGQILATPYRLLEEIGIPRILAAITEDIPALIGAFTTLPFLVTQVAIVIGCVVYLSLLSRPLALMMVAYMVLGITAYLLPARKGIHYSKLHREQWDAAFHAIRALTEGAKELKLSQNRRQAFFSEVLEPPVAGIRRYSILANSFWLAAGHGGQVLFYVFIGLILFLVPRFMPVDGPSLIGYTLVTLFMISPLTFILNNFQPFGRARVAAEKVMALGFSLHNTPPEEATLRSNPNTEWGRLELIGVTHVYRCEGLTDDFRLGPLDLALYPGELVFLIGGNGSGKTSIAKLLVGLYEPEIGEIRLDDKIVTRENRDEYRQHFSVVFSDCYLFDRLLGLTSCDLDRKSNEYLAQLQLTHKVQVQNGKLSTLDLSQGQRKRVALLYAYLEDRPIYVFDEWASDQDPVFKQIFYFQLLPDLKSRGKTVVVISHDDGYYHIADRVIKMERGQVVYDRRVST